MEIYNNFFEIKNIKLIEGTHLTASDKSKIKVILQGSLGPNPKYSFGDFMRFPKSPKQIKIMTLGSAPAAELAAQNKYHFNVEMHTNECTDSGQRQIRKNRYVIEVS